MISGYYYLTFRKRFDIGKFSRLDDKWLLLSNSQIKVDIGKFSRLDDKWLLLSNSQIKD